MANVANIVEKRITHEATGVASKMLNKLKKKTGGNNVSTISFPSNLENQAQSTYMTIFIFDNESNQQKFSTTVFNSNIDEDTYEIGAIRALKDWTTEELLDPLKKNLKDAGNYLVKTGEDWLKNAEKKADKAAKDTAEALEIDVNKVKSVKDQINKYIVPHRKQSQSRALANSLDPLKHPDVGYRLEKAIQIQMPSSDLTYKYDNGWESTNTESLNAIRKVAESLNSLFEGGMGGVLKSKNWQNAYSQIAPVLGKIGNKLGDLVTGGGFTADKSARERFVYNPVLVFNYKIPSPRTFSFSFSLYPRNKEELYTLFNLIQTLKFYSLPETSVHTKSDKSQEMTFRYPAKFSIKFYTNGYENKWFPKTLSLGLTSLEETLTGDNGDMAYFENYFDKFSGNPPRMVKLSLNFTELGIMSRTAANEGY